MPCLGRLDIRGRVCGEGERARRLRRGLQQLRERRGDTSTGITRKQGPAFFGGQDEEEEDDVVEIVEADGSDPHTSDRLSAAEDEEDETPAEFLDAITHSLMLLPMTLPSGHTVDRSTVDRWRLCRVQVQGGLVTMLMQVW